ncbi:MAG: NAD(P)-binding domain-containing protein [Coriobacteriia bacterium]|nr:NAD(P)-binding domain-containing protein [Coriobacteriia bacterium]
MRVAVIGTGTVGRALASGLVAAGHTVALGTRDPERQDVAELAARYPDAVRIADYRAAVIGAELVFLAVPGRLVLETVTTIGAEAFADAIIVDLTNPIVLTEDGAHSAFADDDSAAESIQRALPGARVVKALNQIEAAHMLAPESGGGPVRIAGDDDGGKRVVAGLLESFGWTVRDLGPLKRARPLERAAVEWAGRQRLSGAR